MNKKRLLLKLILLVVGGVAVILLSSCFTSLKILSCKKSCQESCNSSSDDKDNISGHENGIYYSLSNSGDFYWVEEVGYNETSVVIPETYDGLPVMKIRSGAFTHYRYGSGCGGDYSFGMSLTSLTLPKTIIAIESGVFAGYHEHYRGVDPYYREGAICEKLIFQGTVADWCNIDFGSSPFTGTTDFYIGDEKVTDLVVPDGVTKIKEDAFAYYSGLTSLALPESLTEIEEYAFYSCYNLEEVAFNCTDLKVGQFAFQNCQKLQKIDFTGEKLVLGNDVFGYCVSLKEVNWNSVEIKTIPQAAFIDCSALEIFVIPASVENIETDAFTGCYKISEVFNFSELEVVAGSRDNGGVAYYAGVVYTEEAEDSKILTVGDYKFVVNEESATLFKYTGGDTVLILPELEDGKTYDIRSNTFINNLTITTVSIPECVTAIGNNAFYSCENLQVVTGCKGIVSVGDRAFNWCLKLVSIELDKVEEIGDYAFHNCIALKSMKLPENLTKIGGGAFYNCEGLTSLALPVSLKEVGGAAFANCNAELTYAGTLEEWESITKSEYPYAEVTVTCSDGEVWEGKI